jgi:hypothetical protein
VAFIFAFVFSAGFCGKQIGFKKKIYFRNPEPNQSGIFYPIKPGQYGFEKYTGAC